MIIVGTNGNMIKITDTSEFIIELRQPNAEDKEIVFRFRRDAQAVSLGRVHCKNTQEVVNEITRKISSGRDIIIDIKKIIDGCEKNNNTLREHEMELIHKEVENLFASNESANGFK